MSASLVKDTRDPPSLTQYGTVGTSLEQPEEPIIPIRQFSGWWGARHTFAFMSFLGMANLYAMRVNLSVAIVAMTKSVNNTQIGSECPVTPTEDEDLGAAEFDWDSNDQGLILGAFFYGYIITQIPGGYFAEKFGGKWFLFFGTLATTIFTLLSPVSARHSSRMFVVCRVLMGLGEGVTFPAMQALISKWLPSSERSKLGAVIWGGTQAGTVAALSLSGLISEEWGWEWVFYFFGIFGCLWCAGWLVLCHDSPATHPRITEEERLYIEANIPSKNEGTALPFPPLKAIFMTPAFLALIIVHFGNNWGLYTLLTEIPSYLNNIQHFSLTTNGFLSALPYLLMWLSSIPVGLFADYLIVSGKMKTVNVRRLAQAMAHYGPAIALIVLANVGCNQVTAVVCLCFSVALTSGTYSGFQLNHVELSPNYAGTLMGITNMISNVCGFLCPLLVGYITHDNQTLEAWGIVFYIAAAIYIVFNTVFIIFAKSTVQPWNAHWENPLNG